jgi:hypothetical protein
MSPALDLAPAPTATTEVLNLKLEAQRTVAAATAGVYYNARLDPANYMDGPLSCNPATRLRQMLARPGIIVGALLAISRYMSLIGLLCRLRLGSAMVSVHDAP